MIAAGPEEPRAGAVGEVWAFGGAATPEIPGARCARALTAGACFKPADDHKPRCNF